MTKPPRMAASRAALLAGVSLTALVGAGFSVPAARAAQPALFSPQWFAARAQAATTAAVSGAASKQSAQVQAAQSVSDLTKMAAAIKAAQAFQASAAAAASASGVPNGLVTGGLAVAPGATPGNSLWIGANLPTQSVSGAQTTVTVQQTQPQALLNWQSFNVGQHTTLAFDQSTVGGSNAANWVALNKIPASASPSQILGTINAPGKVFLINQSGIIFGAGSQINVNSLIASAADLPASITTGVNGAASTVSFSIYGAQSGSSFAASFLGAPAGSTIDVEPGAQITTSAPAAAASGGGYVMLFGGTARNAGDISTPYGQTVLASGQDFVLRAGYSTTGNQIATTRGSQIATIGLAGSTENDGIIAATDGDITLAGHTILQSGVVFASTSVNARGTVHLLSDTADTTGSITLSPGSITTVQPDDSQATALNSQRSQLIAQSASLDILRTQVPSSTNPQVNNVGTLADRLDLSRIEITTGGSVEFAAGSITMAQGGQIAVQAGGRVQADSTAALDVSGQLNVALPMSANQLTISVQPYEQRDAPVNRIAGGLDSTSITLDINNLVLVPASTLYPTDRYYSGGGLLEVSGYLNTTGHTIGEWTALGGTITLAGSEVVAQSQSVFNVSGGSLSYQGGMLSTSYLLGADGHIYNANTAPAGVQYTGIYAGQVIDHSRWNVSDVFVNPLFTPAELYQAGYVVGRDAGSVIVSAPTAIFEGTIAAGVVTGPYQTAARAASLTDGYAAAQNIVPQAGTFALGQYNANGLAGAWSTDVRFQNAPPALADSLTIASPIPTDRVQTAWLSSAALNAAGLGGLSVATAQSINVIDGITLAPGGVATLVAPTITFTSGITARGGSVNAGNILVTTTGSISTRGALGTLSAAEITLGAGATIDTRGLWTNAQLDPALIATQAYINGGNVTLDSTGSVSLAAGSLIDASSGAALLAGGKTLGGKGGSVTLIGNDPALAQADASASVSVLGTVQSYGVSGGGTLTLVAQNVLVTASQPVPSPGTVWLGPAFFAHGFTTYDVTGVAGVSVGDGTIVQAAAPVYRFSSASSNAPTGSDPASAMQLWLPPLYVVDPLHATLTQRPGVSLILRADANTGSSAARGGPVTLGDNAILSVDPGQTVRLEGYGQITVDGTIDAPGGRIAVVNTREENYTFGLSPGFTAGLSVWLGAASRLDAAAQAVTAIGVDGRSFGVVPAGGTITIGSSGGAQNDGAGSIISTDALVIVRPGAVVDASGASGIIDPAAGSDPALGAPLLGGGIPTLVASSGGTISLSSYNGIYIDGALHAAAGGAGAAGGTLAITLEAPLYASNAPEQPGTFERMPRVILISQAATSDLGSGAYRPGSATPDSVRDQARISETQIKAGGFANLSLFARDGIVFDGNVALAVSGSIRFQQGVIAETDPAAQVAVSAPYVLLSGSTVHTADTAVSGISITEASWQPDSAATAATLTVSADLIDISNDVRFGVQAVLIGASNPQTGAAPAIDVAYPGFASIALNSAGDVRFNTSSFVTPGSLAFSAAQLYPTTQAAASVYAGVNYYLPTVSVVQSDGSTVDVGQNIYAPGNALTIAWNGIAAAAPYSAAGSLILAAPTVEQGGVVRAPEGNITFGAVIEGPVGSPANQNSYTGLVELQPGSITSVSAAGQTIPFGGSADNQTYRYNGQAVTPLSPGIAVHAAAIQSDPTATLDISGGGDLSGAVFQSGRGGSADTLLQPLMNFTGTAQAKASLTTDPVYAIVPGVMAGYAPVAPLDQSSGYGGSVPATGADITLASAVDGLPAGTYTLLPSYYALLPGAFRVELNTASHAVASGVTELPGGSYLVGGYTGVANAGVQSALPVPVTLTPGSAVRTYSQYVETSYSQFQIAIAASTGAPRAAIPEDAKQLTLMYPSTVLAPSTVIDPNASTLPALSYAGVSNFKPASGGFGSTVMIEGQSGASNLPDIEIVPAGAVPTAGYVTIGAADLNALGASRLVIGGSAIAATNSGAPTVTFNGQASSVTLRGGAVLSAPEVFLVAAAIGSGTGAVTVETGAAINTVGAGAAPYDSTNGYFYNSSGFTVVAASNGNLNFTPDTSASQFFGAIDIADGATLTSAGTLAFSTTRGLTLGAEANYGAKYISLDVASVNILSTAVQNAGTLVTLPSGLLLSQTVLDRLLAGDPASGVPAVASLSLTATQSVNLFGGVSLSTGGAGSGLQQFVLNTPAIYGWSDLSVGGTSDVASIAAGSGTLVWNGIAASLPAGAQTQLGSQAPGGFASTGLASGSGTLELSAQTIVLGYPAGSQVQNQVSLARTVVGFATVDLTATQAIEGNAKGSMSVYAAPAALYGQPGSGGDLNLSAPVLTGQAGAVTAITAGGTLTVSGAGGSAAAGGLGAEIDLTAASIALNSTVALPSGRFTATAQTGISLGQGGTLALAGQTAGFFDQTSDTPGGTAILATASGGVVQAAGSTIDVSAGKAAAGRVSITALGGTVSLGGTVLGGAASGQTQGSIDIRAGSLPDFAKLNQALTAGGFTGARAFEIATGDLTVGNELVANNVSLSLDGGSLTVTGLIDASGSAPGTIDLAAMSGLTMATGAVLDAHATVLHTDSYGAPIDAENAPQVTLTVSAGTLTLQSGIDINVQSADAVARGDIALHAPRKGNDNIAVSIGGPLSIEGVWTGAGQPSGSLALYGWRDYTVAPLFGTTTALVTQALLDRISFSDTVPFMNRVTASATLAANLQPLADAAQGAFHIRPGVQISSTATDGSMAVAGDLNLAKYRYGPNGGEPGALLLRASGSLSINGSITDGFGVPADNHAFPNPDTNGWVLFGSNEPFGADIVLPVNLVQPIELGAGTTFPTANAVALNYPITIQAATLNQGIPIPATVTLDVSNDPVTQGYAIPAGGWVATAPVTDGSGNMVFKTGSVMPAGTVLQPGWTVGAGSVLPFQINVPDGTVWPSGASLQAFSGGAVTLFANQAIGGGAFIPSGSTVTLASGAQSHRLRTSPNGQQGEIWAIAPMLPAGAMSWDIALVSGANMAAASPISVQPQSALNGGGGMVLSDLHYTHPDYGPYGATPSFSVIRTGQGNLTLASGGDITQYSLYGIYTAGTQSAAVDAAFQLPQAGAGDGTVLGWGDIYNKYALNYQAYYPTAGGNVLVSAQGGLYGDIYGSSSSYTPASDWVGNWLWRQGTGGTTGVAAQSTAWWINFGTYVWPQVAGGLVSQPELVGFTGIGTLGGGNLTVSVGGDAGVTVGRDSTQRSQGLDLAVASTGRVTDVTTAGGAASGGTLLQTGGGTLSVTIGGALNGLDEGAQNVTYDGLNGTFTNLRGAIAVQAGQIGRIVYNYGTIDPADTRPLNPYVAGIASEQGGLIVVPGDASVQLTAMRDLVLAGAGDAGRLPAEDQPGFTYTAADGTVYAQASGGIASFSLWTPATAIALTSLGGNLTPTTQPLFGSLSTAFSNDMPTDSRFIYPPTLLAAADSGSIYYGTLSTIGTSMNRSLELAPAPDGQLELLARGSIYATGYSIDISGANANSNLTGGTNAAALPNPFQPSFTGSFIQADGSLGTATNDFAGASTPYSLFAFGADTPTSNLHANDTQPARIYAAGGDIVDLRFGEILSYGVNSGIAPSTWYIAAKPAWIMAGRDIVAAGTRPALDPSNPAVGSAAFGNEPNQQFTANPAAITSGNLILNDGAGDVSVVSAGRDILNSYFYIGGPGLLEVQAGRNLDQQNQGILKSLGPIYDINSQNRDGGAGISVLAGTGAAGVDATDFAKLYFNPANLADPAYALTAPQNQGKVAETYTPQLLAWLQQAFGYTGSDADALAFFLALPAQQQAAFVRQVFFDELLASGREESDPASRRYHSYVRGTEAIYALLPWTAAPQSGSDPNYALDEAAYQSVIPASVTTAHADGTAPSYLGGVTMYSGTVTPPNGSVITDSVSGRAVVFDSGISTQFGGDIQVLAPGGQILLGLSGGVQPGSNTGLITFGSGNIAAFAQGSIVLGQSRIFTTFGGNIQLWSATGDVNAGIGAKTSVIYQPPSITYDAVGGLTEAPTAPTNGAGIATLSSVPGVPAGDVDLVAPQGTIDAGEAGIRVSGNLTLAALAVSNTANLSVGGKTAGAPAIAVSNIGALQAAGSTAGAAQNAASDASDQQRRKRQATEGSVILVEVLGFGE